MKTKLMKKALLKKILVLAVILTTLFTFFNFASAESPVTVEDILAVQEIRTEDELIESIGLPEEQAEAIPDQEAAPEETAAPEEAEEAPEQTEEPEEETAAPEEAEEVPEQTEEPEEETAAPEEAEEAPEQAEAPEEETAAPEEAEEAPEQTEEPEEETAAPEEAEEAPEQAEEPEEEIGAPIAAPEQPEETPEQFEIVDVPEAREEEHNAVVQYFIDLVKEDAPQEKKTTGGEWVTEDDKVKSKGGYKPGFEEGVSYTWKEKSQETETWYDYQDAQEKKLEKFFEDHPEKDFTAGPEFDQKAEKLPSYEDVMEEAGKEDAGEEEVPENRDATNEEDADVKAAQQAQAAEDQKKERADISVDAEFTVFEGSVSKSYRHAEVSDKGEYGEYKVEADFIKAGADYSAGFGFGYDNKTGTFNAGVRANAKADFAYATVQAEGKYGVEDLNVSGKADASVGTAKAKAGADIGYRDGKLNAMANVGLEANLVEAHAKASGEVLGVKMSAKATVKVGIGVTAKVGFKGGKFQFKLGAAVGVGADISFSVDVSGAAKKVTNAACAVADSVTSGVKKAWNWLFG